MNLPPIALPLVDGDTLFIDNSSLEHFTTCPRQALYSIVRRLRPSGERSALIFGGIVHKVLEARYRACSTLHAQTTDITNVMIATAQREFDKWTPPEDDFRTFSTVVELIRRYELEYPFESFEVVRDVTGQPMIEVPFAIPLGELAINSELRVLNVTTGQEETRQVSKVKVVWQGRIDMAYVSTNGGGLYVMDHKTTSIMGPSYFDTFTISHQLYGYAWAVEKLCNHTVSAVVINALGVRKPSRTGTPFEFKRDVIPVQRGLLDEWKKDTIYIVADFIEMCRRGYLPKHTVWCVGKFGQCPFRKVCTLESDDQREIMLQSGEYQSNDWSPLK